MDLCYLDKLVFAVVCKEHLGLPKKINTEKALICLIMHTFITEIRILCDPHMLSRQEVAINSKLGANGSKDLEFYNVIFMS
jgi:hypothetical protein